MGPVSAEVEVKIANSRYSGLIGKNRVLRIAHGRHVVKDLHIQGHRAVRLIAVASRTAPYEPRNGVKTVPGP